MGRFNYYTTYTDRFGDFTFSNVRSGAYALQAWSNGTPIADVTTTYLQNDVEVKEGKQTRLLNLVWKTQNRKAIWRIGDVDRRALGFQYGGAPHQHALVANCPANLTFIPGKSPLSTWCFGQSALGTWTVEFDLNASEIPSNSEAVLSVSLAGYSSGVSSTIIANGATVGNLTSADILSDPCLYRSATSAGEWHYFEFPVGQGILKEGTNQIAFEVTRTTLWHGFMWDAVLLEWAN